MKFSAAGGWFGGDWYSNVRAAAKYGFQAVEHLGWDYLDLQKAKDVLDETGMTSTCLVIQSVNNPKNKEIMSWGHGMVWEDSRPAFLESFRESVNAAKIMGVPNICATVGNRRNDVSSDEQFDICVTTLKQMAHIAEEEGIMIVVEPLNILVNHMGYYLVTTEDAVRMIKAVDSPNCKILFDIYHQQISEGNVIRNATENIDLIGHFHIGDNPGRNEPGTGEIQYDNVFKAIRDAGYTGYLAFECGRTVSIPELCVNMHNLIDRYDVK